MKINLVHRACLRGGVDEPVDPDSHVSIEGRVDIDEINLARSRVGEEVLRGFHRKSEVADYLIALHLIAERLYEQNKSVKQWWRE